METRKFVNLCLVSGLVLVTGLSMTLLAPFYPTEALARGVTVSQSGGVL